MKPIILITGYHVEDAELQDYRPRGVKGQDMTMCTCDYSDAVYEAGGIPLVIPNIDSYEYCEELADIADGVIFSGGEDINPKHFGEKVLINNLKIIERRDNLELKLAKKILTADTPVLGICRGMQLINAAAGGSLYQDIYAQAGISSKHGSHGRPKDFIIHDVYIEQYSRLNQIYGIEKKGVNSYHHQAVKELSNTFDAAAYSEDGLIEAYEMRGERFFVCVQWHPEMMYKRHKEELELFKSFITACSVYKSSKK